MPLNIPLPGDPGENLVGASQDFRNIFQKLMENKLEQQKLSETGKYHSGSLEQQAKELALKQQQEQREGKLLQPKLDLLKAQIESLKALSKQREMGGGKFSSGTGDELKYHSTVALYNPELNQSQLREAADVYASGGNILSDGTKLAPMNPTLKRALDRAVKSTTTANLINQSIQSKQAQAEMPIFDKYINEGVQPYGETTFGISPQQIKDSLDVKNPEAQKRLANYMAAQQLLYDRAALTLKINSLPAGKRIADEIKKLSFQSVNEKFPQMSAESRKLASERVAKALEEALKARQSVSIGSSTAFGKENESDIEKGLAVMVDKYGNEYTIFRDRFDDAKTKHPNAGFKLKKESFNAAKI